MVSWRLRCKVQPNVTQTNEEVGDRPSTIYTIFTCPLSLTLLPSPTLDWGLVLLLLGSLDDFRKYQLKLLVEVHRVTPDLHDHHYGGCGSEWLSYRYNEV